MTTASHSAMHDFMLTVYAVVFVTTAWSSVHSEVMRAHPDNSKMKAKIFFCALNRMISATCLYAASAASHLTATVPLTAMALSMYFHCNIAA